MFPENVEAWRIFGLVATRFTMEFGLASEVFRQCVRDWDADDVLDLTERLTLIYDVLYPPKPESD